MLKTKLQRIMTTYFSNIVFLLGKYKNQAETKNMQNKKYKIIKLI